MKTKLEAIANVAVIVTAMAVGYVFLEGKVASSRKPPSIEVGRRLGEIPGIDWSLHQRTLVLALNTGCHFCEESVPLYQRLAHAQTADGEDLGIVAVFPNDPGMVWLFMAKANLHIRSVVVPSLEGLLVDAIPTLILVDNQGLVERSWVGALTRSDELELFKSVFGPSTTIPSKTKNGG